MAGKTRCDIHKDFSPNCFVSTYSELPDVSEQNDMVAFQKRHGYEIFGEKTTSENSGIVYLVRVWRSLGSDVTHI